MAQDNRAAEPVSGPEVTTASYGDWVLRCIRTTPDPKPMRVCEVAQTLVVQGQSAPVAQLAVGRVKAGDPLRVTIVVPNNVALDAAARIGEEKDGQGIAMTWRRCAAWGCAADVEIKPDQLARWRAAKNRGLLQFTDAANQPVVLPFSFRGLAQSLDATPSS